MNMCKLYRQREKNRRWRREQAMGWGDDPSALAFSRVWFERERERGARFALLSRKKEREVGWFANSIERERERGGLYIHAFSCPINKIRKNKCC